MSTLAFVVSAERLTARKGTQETKTMKTLNEAVQAAIVTEAGSTYRNVLLSFLKEFGVVNTEHAEKATQSFLTLIIDNIEDRVQRTDGEIDYSKIAVEVRK